VHWDLGSSLSYSEYLRLDRLLDAQNPLSTEHDEMLFIIVHQVSELWMRLMLHELHGGDRVRAPRQLGPSFKMLDRIGRVQAQLLAVWEVLSTMTPADYSAFRNLLGRSSGFQSVQYRLLEFTLGNKHPEMIEVHRRDEAAYLVLARALAAPSLYDEVLRLLSQRGYGVPASSTAARFHQPYAPPSR
jgi:tryptophan 2,3-dioxygenase